jgi:hypothetical protein
LSGHNLLKLSQGNSLIMNVDQCVLLTFHPDWCISLMGWRCELSNQHHMIS